MNRRMRTRRWLRMTWGLAAFVVGILAYLWYGWIVLHAGNA